MRTSSGLLAPPAADRPSVEAAMRLVRAAESAWAGPECERFEVTVPHDGPSIASGIVHEWFGVGGADRRSREPWHAPLCLLARIAALALERSPGLHAVWIGRRSRPNVDALGGAARLLRRSVFIDPPDSSARLWAIDLALRCPAVAVVVADGSGCTMAASRRLQLAAKASPALALIARPPHERRLLSAAGARWLAAPELSHTRRPRWAVELLRCKGVQPAEGSPRRWALEWDHAKGLVAVPAGVAARPAGAEGAALRPRPARTA